MDKLIDALESLRIPDSDFFGVGHETQNLYACVNDKLDECLELIMNIEQPIYEVLVYSHPWRLDEHGLLDFGSEERVGFYYEKNMAIQAVEENWCDLQDHYAHAAMIKEIAPGLYPLIHRTKCWYYIWNPQEEKFEKAEVPASDWFN